MNLQHLSWAEVEEYLKTRSGIIIPCGSTEQHGPNGMIGTDAICAEALALRVGSAGDILVAPTLAMGQAQFNLSWPGTISLRAETLMNVVRDVVTSLAGQGFSHFYFLNGHGGNVAPLQAAFQDIYRDYGTDHAVRCRIRSWWDHAPVNELRHRQFAEWEGLHATPSEVSITQAVLHALSSQTEKPADLTPLTADFTRNHGGDNHFDQASHRAQFPDGRIGSDPWLATPEAGHELITTATAAIAADYAAFLTE
jgi:creatinine amidohydrolase